MALGNRHHRNAGVGLSSFGGLSKSWLSIVAWLARGHRLLCIGAIMAGLVACYPNMAAAQTIVTDGDTIKIDGTIYRLWGIDAPEMQQLCADGWPAGQHAKVVLTGLMRGKEVVCEGRSRDRYGRVIALCRADGVDLSRAMVESGHALAFTRYAQDYVAQEENAKAQGLGLHVHNCTPPWEWRAERRPKSSPSNKLH